MPSKKQTTVVLAKEIQKIKTELAGVYGLKNLLSASILHFSRETDTKQKSLIKEINKLDIKEEQAADPEKMLEELKEIFAKEEGNKTMFTSAEVAKIISEFRKKISPAKEEIHHHLKQKNL